MSPGNRLSTRAARSLRDRRLGLTRNAIPGAAAGEGILAADQVGAPGHQLARWLAERFNHNFDDYDRAIDHVFNMGEGGSPQLHHLIDGQHSVWDAFKAVQDVSADDSWVTELGQALEHLARDTASISGINPFFSLTPAQFDTLGKAAADVLGINKLQLADALTLNGPELLGGSVALVSALLMGRRPEPERLSRFSGGCLLSATVSANPMLLPIAAAGMAYAVYKAEDKRAVLVQAGKGALVSGTALLVTSLVGGPVWLGCAAAVVAAVAVSKAIDDPRSALERANRLIRPATEVFHQVAPVLRGLRVEHV